MVDCPCCPVESEPDEDGQSRRGFLGMGLAAAGMAAAALSLGASPASAQRRRVLAPLGAAPSAINRDLPLVDFHTHLQRRAAAEDLIAKMDATGVARLVLMPLYYRDSGSAVNDGEGSDEQARDYGARYPGRFVPFVGMQRGELNGREVMREQTPQGIRLLRETEAKLRTGDFFG